MKRAVVVVLASLVLFAGGLGWHMLERRSASTPHAASAGDVRGPRHSAVRATTEPRVANRVEPVRAHAPSPLIRVGDPVYGVRTQAEADWLNRNRFPVREPGMTTAPVISADLQGPLTADAIASAELAAMTRPELRERALTRLRQAAEDGSISALRALSLAYEFRQRDIVMANAYARAAEMRGDWSPRIATYHLDPLQAMAAAVLAHRILHDIDHARRRRGLAPLVRDERPGLVEASDALLQAHRTGNLRLPVKSTP